MDAVAAIFWSTLGGLITILVIGGAKRISAIWAKQAMYRFWNFLHRQVVIVYPIYQDPQGEPMPPNMARIEDVIAMELLVSLLKKRGIEYRMQDDRQELPENADIILVCSPKGSKQSASFSKRVRLPFSFCRDEQNPTIFYFRDIQTDVEYWSPSDKQMDKKNDFGLVGRYTDDNPRRRVFLFWGIHGVGTLAAVKFALIKQNIKKVCQEIGDRDFAVLIQAPFSSPREVGEASLVTPLLVVIK